ncbi:DUF1266 domain-containing protein [Gilliamella sp. wkB112]|uniref:DUF1266 domain-containing protein n=1 Tax=Gilliamella sp. wkB112 TaxID=3120257 RepID=UPI00080E6088|nr:DUF1266 domain-containing protein [Gilliamella apicola]OCG00451.1 hypothetical protein A9G12_05015 [Gilliamella apicola]
MDQNYIDWLYGLSAPMVALNKEHGASYTSPFFFPDRDFVNMNDDWGIDSRESLLEMVFNMVDNGHATALTPYYFMYDRLPEYKWLEYCQSQTDYQKVLLKMAEQTFSECGVGGIRAWDYARMGYILRNGTTNKYITEQEALWIFSRIASRSQYYYKSWKHYFSGWLVGYQYWKSLSNDKNLDILRCELSRMSKINIISMLNSDEDSPCNRLPWFIDIEELEKPESLMEYDWS